MSVWEKFRGGGVGGYVGERQGEAVWMMHVATLCDGGTGGGEFFRNLDDVTMLEMYTSMVCAVGSVMTEEGVGESVRGGGKRLEKEALEKEALMALKMMTGERGGGETEESVEQGEPLELLECLARDSRIPVETIKKGIEVVKDTFERLLKQGVFDGIVTKNGAAVTTLGDVMSDDNAAASAGEMEKYYARRAGPDTCVSYCCVLDERHGRLLGAGGR